ATLPVAAAVMLDRYDTGHLATLPVASAGCFLLGLGFGVPALRLRGLYLALSPSRSRCSCRRCSSGSNR
ncbi:hypothetical protein RMT89_36425, partial [Streptomyces sp. P17]|nr:hypothetical protein [Streptomyces sp. P17]